MSTGTRVAAASLALRGVGLDGGAPVEIEWEPIDGPRFPNGAVAIAPVPSPGPAGAPPAGAPAAAAIGAARCGPALVAGPIQAGRWWDPTCPVGVVDPARARRFVGSLDPLPLPGRPEDLIGWGPGRTPAGDDVVVGLLIGFRAAGRPDLAADLALAAGLVPAHSAGQDRVRCPETVPFSRALLDHAVQGEAAGPVLDLVRALAGQRPLAPTVDALHHFGATSGRHLLAGIRRALVEVGFDRCGHGVHNTGKRPTETPTPIGATV